MSESKAQECSEDAFLEQIQIATLAMSLDTPPPQIKPTLWQRARRWFKRERAPAEAL